MTDASALGVSNRPFWLRGHGLQARMMPWGAVLMDLRLDGHADPLVLGFDDPGTYPDHSRYFGATAGRFANRIANGRFEIDGQAFQTDQNFLGKHTLHGGSQPMGKQRWKRLFNTRDAAIFTYRARSGEMGFPGNLAVTARFSLRPNATFRIHYTATTDAPTLCNLAHHTYWALDGSGDLSHHRLQLEADRYLPVNHELIPTGEVADVTGTRYDFRAPAPIIGPTPIDHNLCLSDSSQPIRKVGTLHSTLSGISMEIATTEPGIQVYDSAPLSIPVPGLDGRSYGPHAGVALEPQKWPDAPNHAHFPDAVLRPGEVYEQITEFRFS